MGYFDIRVLYDAAQSQNQGLDSLNFYYSDDGGTFALDSTDALTTSFATFDKNLLSVTAIENNANATLRLIGFDASQTSCFLELDNIQVTGCALPSSLSLGKSASPTRYMAAGEASL